jgi:hypothetical protein
MTYHQLITRAVDELDSNTEEARRALYERARTKQSGPGSGFSSVARLDRPDGRSALRRP